MKPQRILQLSLVMTMLCAQLTAQPVWQFQESGITSDLVSVSFADTSYGWAAARDGSMIHTSNGGDEWEPGIAPEGFLPNKIFFQNRDTGWMVGSFSPEIDTAFILRTADGGGSWDINYYRISGKLNDIFFVNDTVGFAVGFVADTLGLRLKTVNAGEQWLDLQGPNIISEFYSVHFRDTAKGVICGSGPTLQRTTSGGITPPGMAQVIFNFEKEMFDLVSVGDIYGLMVGADGKVWFTKDDWNNYLDYEYTEGDTLRAVDGLEPLSFYVVGDSGTILLVGYNQFFGLTALDQSLDISQDLLDVVAVDDAHIWAVGEEGTILFFGFGEEPISPGIENIDLPAKHVFPNPAHDHFFLPCHGGMDPVLKLYDLKGNLVRAYPVVPSDTAQKLDISGLNPGIYLLDTGLAMHKIVKVE